MLVFIGAKENNFRNSVTGYYKNNKDEQKTIVKTILILAKSLSRIYDKQKIKDIGLFSKYIM